MESEFSNIEIKIIGVVKKILGSDKFPIFITILLFIVMGFDVGVARPYSGTEKWWGLPLYDVTISSVCLLIIHYYNPKKNRQFITTISSYYMRVFILFYVACLCFFVFFVFI